MAKARKKLVPFRNLSPDYRARIRAKAEKEGISVRALRAKGASAARGHAVRTHGGRTEAEERRLREVAKVQAGEAMSTTAQRQAAKRWVQAYAAHTRAA